MHGRDYSGTFLPEVAAEEKWDQKTTLEYLVKKAGYRNDLDNVKDKIKIKTYESKKTKMSYEQYLEYIKIEKQL